MAWHGTLRRRAESRGPLPAGDPLPAALPGRLAAGPRCRAAVPLLPPRPTSPWSSRALLPGVTCPERASSPCVGRRRRRSPAPRRARLNFPTAPQQEHMHAPAGRHYLINQEQDFPFRGSSASKGAPQATHRPTAASRAPDAAGALGRCGAPEAGLAPHGNRRPAGGGGRASAPPVAHDPERHACGAWRR